MRLIIVRHARAKDRDAQAWPDDTQRPLTKGGRRDFARLAARLPNWIDAPAAVLASGWVRAWDTAAILCNETGWPDPIRCRALETAGGAAAVDGILQELRARSDQEAVVLVGHEPVLGELLARLLGGHAMVAFSKGAVALVDMHPQEGRGALLALVPPQAVQRP